MATISGGVDPPNESLNMKHLKEEKQQSVPPKYAEGEKQQSVASKYAGLLRYVQDNNKVPHKPVIKVHSEPTLT